MPFVVAGYTSRGSLYVRNRSSCPSCRRSLLAPVVIGSEDCWFNSQVKEKLPKYGEQEPLKAVGQNAGLESAAEKSEYTVLEDDQSCRLRYRVECLVSNSWRQQLLIRTKVDLLYETLVSFTWRYVLTTLREFETESDITDAQNPMKARRASHTMRGCFGGSARTSERKLYYQNQMR